MVDRDGVSHDENICSVFEAASFFVTTLSILSVLLIAIDQYFAVVDPLHYRARINKCNCDILIIAVWLVSSTFCLLAFLNPAPQSLWLSCSKLHSLVRNVTLESNSSTLQGIPPITVESKNYHTINGLILSSAQEQLNNKLSRVDVASIADNKTLHENIIENLTLLVTNSDACRLKFAFLYAMCYSTFIYLLPFLAITWIYIKINSAARANLKRTRRTGSRPRLLSSDFSEDYLFLKQEASVEDFQRLPKMSSLSSIEEATETSMNTALCNNDSIDLRETDNVEMPCVIFTVGSNEVDDCELSLPDNNAKDMSQVPITSVNPRFVDYEIFIPKDEIESNYSNGSNEQEHVVKSGIINLKTLRNTDDEVKSLVGTIGYHENNDTNEALYLKCEVNETKVLLNEKIDELMPIYITRNVDDIEKNQINNKSELSSSIENYKPASNVTELINESDILCTASFHQQDYSVRNFEANCDTKSKFIVNDSIVSSHSHSHETCLRRTSSIRSTLSYINSIKHKFSTGSFFKCKAETRAAKVSALVIVMGFICWTPSIAVLLMRHLTRQQVPHKYEIWSIHLFVMTAYVSPLLFGYRSKRIKRELRRFFCFWRELSYKNNRSLMAKKVLKRRGSTGFAQAEVDKKFVHSGTYPKHKFFKDNENFVHFSETNTVAAATRSSFSSGSSTQASNISTDDS